MKAAEYFFKFLVVAGVLVAALILLPFAAIEELIRWVRR